MLTTKRYEYLHIGKIGINPMLTNHRPLDMNKVAHLEKDILTNGLLEPLVVWERTAGEFYLVGGFHRMEAIKQIRRRNPTYFDNVDVRVVNGDPDEIKALNLKLNTDRVDTKVTDYFQTVIYLSNAKWPKERIAEFFDKSASWIDEIIRYAPMVTERMYGKLVAGEISWNRAKEIIQKTLGAPVGQEKATLEGELAKPQVRIVKPLPFRSAIGRLSRIVETQPDRTYTVAAKDLYALVVTLQGKAHTDEHVERVRQAFPELLND